MLDTYRKLEAQGVIGRMQKVDASGKIIENDAEGKVPGTLVARPFVEFPKVIRRFDKAGKVYETIVYSKNEELKLLAEDPESFGDAPMSPIERERNDLAQQNAEYAKALSKQESQIEVLTKQLSDLAAKIDQGAAQKIALGQGTSALSGKK